MENQKNEINTIKERTIKLNLSDADIERICLKAGKAGLSVPELIENFIGDLVNGTYSNGSDERMYANEWFNRCWFGMFPQKKFLSYLAADNAVEDIVNWHEEIRTLVEEVKYAEDHPTEYENDEITDLKEELEYYRGMLAYTFKEFKEDATEEIGTFEEEMKNVTDWYENMKILKGDNGPEINNENDENDQEQDYCDEL